MSENYCGKHAIELHYSDCEHTIFIPRGHSADHQRCYARHPELAITDSHGKEMERARQLGGASGGYLFSAAVSVARPPADYTARVIPHCDGVAIPLEDARILWQR